MSAAQIATARKHITAAIHELIRATDQCQPGDPLVDTLGALTHIWEELAHDELRAS